MECEKCTHEKHIGGCDTYIEVQHVEILCSCVIATEFALDVKVLRRKAAEQERAKKELQGNEPKRPAKPRLKWRRF